MDKMWLFRVVNAVIQSLMDIYRKHIFAIQTYNTLELKLWLIISNYNRNINSKIVIDSIFYVIKIF